MDADELFHWLLEQDPHVALQWIHEVLEGSRQIPDRDRFNWPGLADVAASFARHKGGRRSSPPDVGWAYVAVLVYNYIIHEAKEHGRFINRYFVASDAKENARFSYEESVMRLRAEFIMKMGSVRGDSLLDIDHLVQWFLKDLKLTPEEALKKFPCRREDLSRGELWELIRMKRKLALLQRLADRHLLPSDQELQSWLSIQGQLRLQ